MRRDLPELEIVLAAQTVLAPLIQTAEQVAGIRERTGRSKPTVIT